MNRFTIALLILWTILAVLNFVGLFFGVSRFFFVMDAIFACMNAGIAVGMLPMIREAIKLRKNTK